jgi:hypothetical protein
VREAPVHRLATARRRALTQRFATLAALRLSLVTDPAAADRAALSPE